MANPPKEKALTEKLVARLGLQDARVTNALSHPETGVDCIACLSDGRKIAVQVTELDPFPVPGVARGNERRLSEAASNGVYATWGQNDARVVLDALVRAIRRKVQIAERHQFVGYDEIWLLVAAGIPETGAVASTVIHSADLSVADVETATAIGLKSSKYGRCFFYSILGTERALYSWTPASGWHKAVQLEDIADVPRAAYVADLVRAAQAHDCQEVDRLTDAEARAVIRELRGR